MLWSYFNYRTRNYAEQSLCYELASSSKINYLSLSQTYELLGDIYQQKTDYRKSLINYQNASESILKKNSISSLSSDDSTLIQRYERSINLVKLLTTTE